MIIKFNCIDIYLKHDTILFNTLVKTSLKRKIGVTFQFLEKYLRIIEPKERRFIQFNMK